MHLNRIKNLCMPLLVVCAAMNFYASGQVVSATDTLELNITQLFELGVSNNLQLSADRLQERIAYERSKTARMSMLPNIEIGLQAGIIGQPVVFQRGLSDPTRPETPDWQQNYAIDFTQPLYEGGRIKYKMKSADIDREIALLQTASDEADLKIELLRQYLSLFSLYKQHFVLVRNIEESEHRLRDIRRLKEEGVITNNDVLRSEMQLTDNRLSLVQTENDMRLVSQQLDILLGLDENLLLRPDTTLLKQVYELESYEDYVTRAYFNDPSMLLLQQHTAQARNNIALTKADYMPRLSLYASNALARPIARTMVDMYNNTWNIGLSFTYSLSSLYSNRHKVKEARHNLLLTQNREEQRKQSVRINVRNAYLRHGEAIERVEALKLSVKQAEENYRIMRNRYLNQLAILTDLLDADNLRLNAELQLTTARTQVVLTYYELQRAVGNL